MRKQFVPFILGVLIFSFSAFSFAEEHAKPAHGGIILEVGEEAAHIELVHDAKAGKVTLYIMGADAKTPLALKEAPKLNLKTEKGNAQIAMKGSASTFEATDDALKSDPLKGRISLTVADKQYNVDIKDEHKH